MRAVVQKVKEASVTVEGDVIAAIGKGLLVLVGLAKDDTAADMNYIADKCVNLRVFEDEDDVMNRSVKDVEGEVLVVSQFTLYGDARKGRRPSYIDAAPPDVAAGLFAECVRIFQEKHAAVKTGKFRAMMDVALINDGPVTILLSSEKEF